MRLPYELKTTEIPYTRPSDWEEFHNLQRLISEHNASIYRIGDQQDVDRRRCDSGDRGVCLPEPEPQGQELADRWSDPGAVREGSPEKNGQLGENPPETGEPAGDGSKPADDPERKSAHVYGTLCDAPRSDDRVYFSYTGITPTRTHDYDAGLDLYAPITGRIVGNEVGAIDTLLAVQIPPGFFGMVVGRSSLNKRDIHCYPGIIDSDYRGTIRVLLKPSEDFCFERGDRIAQLIVIPCILAEPVLVDSLTQTKRGEGGFGSTGK